MKTVLEIPHRLEIRTFHCILVGANLNPMSQLYGGELGLKSTSYQIGILKISIYSSYFFFNYTHL